MTSSQLLVAFTLGAAALALWSYIRWPGATPATLQGAVIRVLIALAFLKVGATALDIGIEAAPAFAIIVVVAAVVPVLTFAFLASIWFMKVLADRMRGAY
jgi:hypothetical protein